MSFIPTSHCCFHLGVPDPAPISPPGRHLREFTPAIECTHMPGTLPSKRTKPTSIIGAQRIWADSLLLLLLSLSKRGRHQRDQDVVTVCHNSPCSSNVSLILMFWDHRPSMTVGKKSSSSRVKIARYAIGNRWKMPDKARMPSDGMVDHIGGVLLVVACGMHRHCVPPAS